MSQVIEFSRIRYDLLAKFWIDCNLFIFRVEVLDQTVEQ